MRPTLKGHHTLLLINSENSPSFLFQTPSSLSFSISDHGCTHKTNQFSKDHRTHIQRKHISNMINNIKTHKENRTTHDKRKPHPTPQNLKPFDLSFILHVRIRCEWAVILQFVGDDFSGDLWRLWLLEFLSVVRMHMLLEVMWPPSDFK